jgi:hypothetical protein
MHKNATKYNETLSKWCKNKHGASKIMDTLETYQQLALNKIDQLQSHLGLLFIYIYQNIYLKISIKAYHRQI